MSKPIRRKIVAASLALGSIVLGGMASRAQPNELKMPHDADIVINGYMEAQPIGDINGDGVADLVLKESCSPGSVHVLLGPFGEVIDPLEHPGFSITGAGAPGNGCHLPLAPAGDVNGDGLDDVLVGSRSEDPDGRTDAGVVYVVFGKASEEDVSLDLFDNGMQGDLGYRIDGPGFAAYVGQHFSGAGDVNADGVGDIALGLAAYGRTYVVFGQGGSTNVDLAEIDLEGDDPRGFLVRTQNNDRTWG